MDLSSLRKFEILGPDAEELMNTALTRNIKKLSIRPSSLFSSLL